MKKVESINNLKFKKFEPSKINNLAKIIGGEAQLTEPGPRLNCSGGKDYEYAKRTYTEDNKHRTDYYYTTTCDGDTPQGPACCAKQY